MNPHYPATTAPENGDYSLPLVDTMDSAIGETATVMGAMMTEVLRRALRGGIKQLGEELNTYAQARVDATITERTPTLERVAAEVADKSAREAATEVATEEVRALESRTQETSRFLTDRIEKAEETTVNKARDLAAQIEQAEKRVGEVFQAELDKQVQELLHRSRKGTSVLKARLQAMQGATEGLVKQIQDEQNERKTEQNALRELLTREENERRAAEDRLRVDLVKKLESSQARFDEELAGLREVNRNLKHRVAELEKPRGLRALWAWLFGRRKKKEEDAEEDAEAEVAAP